MMSRRALLVLCVLLVAAAASSQAYEYDYSEVNADIDEGWSFPIPSSNIGSAVPGLTNNVASVDELVCPVIASRLNVNSRVSEDGSAWSRLWWSPVQAPATAPLVRGVRWSDAHCEVNGGLVYNVRMAYDQQQGKFVADMPIQDGDRARCWFTYELELSNEHTMQCDSTQAFQFTNTLNTAPSAMSGVDDQQTQQQQTWQPLYQKQQQQTTEQLPSSTKQAQVQATPVQANKQVQFEQQQTPVVKQVQQQQQKQYEKSSYTQQQSAVKQSPVTQQTYEQTPQQQYITKQQQQITKETPTQMSSTSTQTTAVKQMQQQAVPQQQQQLYTKEILTAPSVKQAAPQHQQQIQNEKVPQQVKQAVPQQQTTYQQVKEQPQQYVKQQYVKQTTTAPVQQQYVKQQQIGTEQVPTQQLQQQTTTTAAPCVKQYVHKQNCGGGAKYVQVSVPQQQQQQVEQQQQQVQATKDTVVPQQQQQYVKQQQQYVKQETPQLAKQQEQLVQQVKQTPQVTKQEVKQQQQYVKQQAVLPQQQQQQTTYTTQQSSINTQQQQQPAVSSSSSYSSAQNMYSSTGASAYDIHASGVDSSSPGMMSSSVLTCPAIQFNVYGNMVSDKLAKITFVGQPQQTVVPLVLLMWTSSSSSSSADNTADWMHQPMARVGMNEHQIIIPIVSSTSSSASSSAMSGGVPTQGAGLQFFFQYTTNVGDQRVQCDTQHYMMDTTNVPSTGGAIQIPRSMDADTTPVNVRSASGRNTCPLLNIKLSTDTNDNRVQAWVYGAVQSGDHVDAIDYIILHSRNTLSSEPVNERMTQTGTNTWSLSLSNNAAVSSMWATYSALVNGDRLECNTSTIYMTNNF